MQSLPSGKLIVVLYSLRENVWKLTDFGISVEATSKIALTTQTSKGTTCYRAPELLDLEHATYNNKVDIWALGCVLHELVTHRTLFPHDWAVHQYAANSSTLPEITLPSSSKFWQDHVSAVREELLQIEPQNRPRAAEMSQLFRSYCEILDRPKIHALITNSSYPSLSEWKTVVGSPPLERDFRLAEHYEKMRDQSTATALRQQLILTLRNEAVTESTESTDHMEHISLKNRLQPFLFPNATAKEVLRLIMEAIEADPMDYWLWHIICQINLLRKDIDAAFAACKSGAAKFPTCPSPLMELSNLQAMIGQYSEAIQTQLQMFENEKLVDSFDSTMELTKQLKDRLVPPQYIKGADNNEAERYCWRRYS